MTKIALRDDIEAQKLNKLESYADSFVRSDCGLLSVDGISNWVVSDWKDGEGATGKFEWSAGQFYQDANEDKGTPILHPVFAPLKPLLPGGFDPFFR